MKGTDFTAVGSVVVTTRRSLMVRLKTFVPVVLLESSTCTVKLLVFVPATVGMPERIPALLRFSPAGSVPLLRVQV